MLEGPGRIPGPSSQVPGTALLWTLDLSGRVLDDPAVKIVAA